MSRTEPKIAPFFKALFKMRLLWIFLAVMVGGLGLGAWFIIRFLGARPNELPFPLLFAFIVGMPILIYICYQAYTEKPLQLSAEEQKPYYNARAIREMISAVPLLLGAGATFYFLARSQIQYISVVLLPALCLWLLLRMLLGRLLLGKRPRLPGSRG